MHILQQCGCYIMIRVQACMHHVAGSQLGNFSTVNFASQLLLEQCIQWLAVQNYFNILLQLQKYFWHISLAIFIMCCTAIFLLHSYDVLLCIICILGPWDGNLLSIAMSGWGYDIYTVLMHANSTYLQLFFDFMLWGNFL